MHLASLAGAEYPAAVSASARLAESLSLQPGRVRVVRLGFGGTARLALLCPAEPGRFVPASFHGFKVFTQGVTLCG